MSHRVTTQTEIKDKDVAAAALKQAGYTFDVQDQTIRITSGDLCHASIDLRTGLVSGDTDYMHSDSKFSALKKFYAEEKVKKEFLRQGGYIESRSVNAQGHIVLIGVTA